MKLQVVPKEPSWSVKQNRMGTPGDVLGQGQSLYFGETLVGALKYDGTIAIEDSIVQRVE